MYPTPLTSETSPEALPGRDAGRDLALSLGGAGRLAGPEQVSIFVDDLGCDAGHSSSHPTSTTLTAFEQAFVSACANDHCPYMAPVHLGPTTAQPAPGKADQPRCGRAPRPDSASRTAVSASSSARRTRASYLLRRAKQEHTTCCAFSRSAHRRPAYVQRTRGCGSESDPQPSALWVCGILPKPCCKPWHCHSRSAGRYGPSARI
jgi:hypothetical protein